MSKRFRATPEKSKLLKKEEIKVDLDIGDEVIIKHKEKGRWGKRETRGRVISNREESPFFRIDTGISRTSFLKVDVITEEIQIKKVS
ncbi:hypothetical protein [Wukongibacter sp. M2B1]|uniref:hypothetical protein n=1 Tax=Wukongibacter sp. M2B1 TaxID=3088895 RepID=UPI003D7B695A